MLACPQTRRLGHQLRLNPCMTRISKSWGSEYWIPDGQTRPQEHRFCRGLGRVPEFWKNVLLLTGASWQPLSWHFFLENRLRAPHPTPSTQTGPFLEIRGPYLNPPPESHNLTIGNAIPWQSGIQYYSQRGVSRLDTITGAVLSWHRSRICRRITLTSGKNVRQIHWCLRWLRWLGWWYEWCKSYWWL